MVAPWAFPRGPAWAADPMEISLYQTACLAPEGRHHQRPGEGGILVTPPGAVKGKNPDFP